MPDRERVKRILTVTSCTEFRRGHGAKGEWVIYEVQAVDAKGIPVEEKLRSFKALPVGVGQEYEVERYDHEQYGTSFTLFPPKQKSSERLDVLEGQVADLLARIARLESGAAPAESAGVGVTDY